MTDREVALHVDDDGFVCLVAPDTYAGFVDADWTLDKLLARFVEQMNQGTLFVAFPGPDHALERLTFGANLPSQQVQREASNVVQVGPEGLWLTDYTGLTMAAQFADTGPTTNYSVKLPVTPGRYLVRLHESDGAFHLTVSPVDANATVPLRAVPWFEL